MSTRLFTFTSFVSKCHDRCNQHKTQSYDKALLMHHGLSFSAAFVAFRQQELPGLVLEVVVYSTPQVGRHQTLHNISVGWT